MAQTRTRSAPSVNGSAASSVVEKAQGAGDSVVSAARRARTPALTLGAMAAGVAGGLALGSRMGARRKSGLVRAAEALRDVARELGTATSQVTGTADDVREIKEHLDKANRRSPVEVLLDGLTHRRGAHKAES